LDLLGVLYRRARSLGYRTLDPLDALFRRINGLGLYPPLHLRRHASGLDSLDGSGRAFVAYLKLLLGLRSGQRLWDLGCGCGLLELALEFCQWRGQLFAVDLHRPSILWAQRHISRRIPEFRFVHADIHNSAYWPRGRLSAEQWFAGFPEHDFDVVIAKSLFTHMLPQELDVYLRQLGQRLKPAGKALLTFFLLNRGQEEIRARNQRRFVKPVPDAVYAVFRRIAPSAAVAYEEAHVLDRLDAHGLRIEQGIHYGWWTGRQDALSSQDIVVVTRGGSGPAG
jgi:SAM-dependent methyltransferase